MARTNIEVFNGILKKGREIGYFSDRLPYATQENFTDITKKMFAKDFKADYNDFCDVLVNKIAFTLYEQARFKNRFSKYIKYGIDFGEIIEQIFTGIVDGEDFGAPINDNSTIEELTPYRVNLPNVLSTYISQRTERKYRVTVSRDKLKKAFTSDNGLFTFINEIVNNLFSSSEVDDFTMFKDLLNGVITNEKENFKLREEQKIINDFKIVDRETSLIFVKQVKDLIVKMLDPNTNLNPSGVKQQNTVEEITIFLRGDIANTIQTTLNASSFNPDDLGFTPANFTGKVNIEILSDFGGLLPFEPTGTGVNTTYKQLYRQYNQYGKYLYLSKTKQDIDLTTKQPINPKPKYTGDVTYLNNYQFNKPLTTNNQPVRDIVCMVTTNRLPIISLDLEEILDTINNEKLYTNYVLHKWYTHSFNRFENNVVFFEPYYLPIPNLKVPTISTYNVKEDEFTIQKKSGDHLGELHIYTVKCKKYNYTGSGTEEGNNNKRVKTVNINGIEYPVKATVIDTDGNNDVIEWEVSFYPTCVNNELAIGDTYELNERIDYCNTQTITTKGVLLTFTFNNSERKKRIGDIVQFNLRVNEECALESINLYGNSLLFNYTRGPSSENYYLITANQKSINLGAKLAYTFWNVTSNVNKLVFKINTKYLIGIEDTLYYLHYSTSEKANNNPLFNGYVNNYFHPTIELAKKIKFVTTIATSEADSFNNIILFMNNNFSIYGQSLTRSVIGVSVASFSPVNIYNNSIPTKNDTFERFIFKCYDTERTTKVVGYPCYSQKLDGTPSPISINIKPTYPIETLSSRYEYNITFDYTKYIYLVKYDS